MLNSQRW